jgi:DNA-binding transcriptional ArsR family regulator
MAIYALREIPLPEGLTAPQLTHKLPFILMEVDVQETVEQVAPLLAVLADPNRLRILRVLTEDCQHVSDIVTATGLPQPLVSHHLRVLKDHALAMSERQGSFTTYCLGREVRQALLHIMELAQRLARLTNEAET